MLNSTLRLSRNVYPGVLASITVAVVAVFLNEHDGAPAMLFALLLGLSFKFLSQEGPCVPGIRVSSTTVLRIGVALLGFRITGEQMVALGPSAIVIVAISVTIILGIGLLLARIFNLDWRLGPITGSSVGICGSSSCHDYFGFASQRRRNFVMDVVYGCGCHFTQHFCHDCLSNPDQILRAQPS
jgi:uncharacterized membrane protein YadS